MPQGTIKLPPTAAISLENETNPADERSAGLFSFENLLFRPYYGRLDLRHNSILPSFCEGRIFYLGKNALSCRASLKDGGIVSQQSELCVFRCAASAAHFFIYFQKGKKKMGLINLNCPGCGQPITLDESREFGFCTFCGTKVMVDKTIVEHRGSVKIDNSEFVQKFLENAHRALDKQDWDEVEKYYNLVEQNAPHNMEAVFFSAFGKAMNSLISQDYYKRQQIFQVLNRSISVINDYYEVTDEDKKTVLEMILKYIKMMSTIEFVYHPTQMYEVGGKGWTNELIKSTKTAFLTELNQIQAVHDEAFIRAMISEIQSDIKQKNSACYVATCVYGSYDCPQVWTLRRYRDDTLAASWYGRAFIRLYYAISPALVRWFGKTEGFKKMWRGPLDRIVKRLNGGGVEDTPYRDRSW